MKLGKYQELYRRYMHYVDMHFSSYQEKCMMSHLDDFYTEDTCKIYLDDLCNLQDGKISVFPLNFGSIEELELKLTIYGV